MNHTLPDSQCGLSGQTKCLLHTVIRVPESQRQGIFRDNFQLLKQVLAFLMSIPCAVPPITSGMQCVPHQKGTTRFSSLLVHIKSNKNFPMGIFGNYHCMEFDETQRECHLQSQYFYIIWRLSSSPFSLWTLCCFILKEITCYNEVFLWCSDSIFLIYFSAAGNVFLLWYSAMRLHI